MGIYEAWEDKLSVLESDEWRIERAVPSENVLDGTRVDVLLDPVDFPRRGDCQERVWQKQEG